MKRHIAILTAALALAGCQQESAPPLDHGAAKPTISTTSAGLTLNPATLPSCSGAVIDVVWDAGKAGVTTSDTEVWIGATLDSAKLFAAAGAQGEAKTGPWARPGAHFFLRNKLDNKVIAQAVVGGPACP